MPVNLNVLPGRVVPGVEFRETYAPYSIALDGFVPDAPWFDLAHGLVPRANFNHHEAVDRMATRATCEQVLLAIRQGLFDTFTRDGLPFAEVWVNDCDEDVCTSTFALQNPYLVIGAATPTFNRLVAMEGMLDATAGAYPYPKDMPALEELNWVFYPYRLFRLRGGLDAHLRDTIDDHDRSAIHYESVIHDVHERIMLHLVGRCRRQPLELDYKVLERHRLWSLVEETGANARTGMFSDGVKAYVAVRQRSNTGDGGVPARYTYTIGRMSKFVPFDVPQLLQLLSSKDDHPWGGGDTIGGSNRAHGSVINPYELAKIIEGYHLELEEAKKPVFSRVSRGGVAA